MTLDRRLGSLFVFVFLAPIGCSSSSGSTPRETADSGGGGGDAGADADAGTPPAANDGRDDKPASCYAACQNGSFTCKASGSAATTTVSLAPDQTGCAGTATTSAGALPMKLDCNQAKVCLASAPGGTPDGCTGGLFSAFSFSYTPAGGVENVCTRN